MPEANADRTGRTILLIEDDKELCSLMTDYFVQQGFRIEAAHDGRLGLARALDGEFDLIILDAMLPVLDGFELLRQLRKRRATPVIMLTARTARVDRIAGRMESTLAFGQIDEIMAGGLHAYLDTVRRQANQVSSALYQTFISYPVEAALSA